MNVTQASHWIPIVDNRRNAEDEEIIVGKEYPLVYDLEDDEYYIKTEKGNLSMCYMWHHGKFLVK
jgi:hypothetical protein